MVWDFGLWSQQPGFVHSKGIWGVLNVYRDKLLVLRFRGLGVSWNHTIVIGPQFGMKPEPLEALSRTMNTGTSPYRRGGAPGTRVQFLTKADYGIWDVRSICGRPPC